jgi:hypothetical protein
MGPGGQLGLAAPGWAVRISPGTRPVRRVGPGCAGRGRVCLMTARTACVTRWGRYAPSMGDRTTSSISIAAARPEVMAVIADFAAYPQWAAAVRSAEVISRDAGGRPSQVRFSLDAGMIKDSYVLGYEWDGDAGVRWDLAEQGSVISAMTGGYFLTKQPAGTDVRYDLSVDVRVPLLGMLKRRAEKMIIDTALKGLKTRVEGLHAQAAGAGSRQQDEEEGTT